jgi:Putative zinc-finger
MIDGKLTARERARVTEHLAECESCYEIFAGSAHILKDSREEQLHPAATLRPFERPRKARALRPRTWWAAAALAAVLAATVGLVVFLQGGRGAGPSTEQLASLVGPVPSGEIPWGRRMRGGRGAQEQEILASEREAFELGVRFLDVRLALASGDRNDKDEALRRIAGLFAERMTIPASTKTIAAYHEIRNKASQGVPPPALLAAAAVAERKAMAELDEDPRMVELGRWAEACRHTGQNGHADLFREPTARRVLDEAMRPGGKEEDSLDPQALAKVRSIHDAIASGRIDPATLGGQCTDLIRQLVGEDQ